VVVVVVGPVGLFLTGVWEIRMSSLCYYYSLHLPRLGKLLSPVLCSTSLLKTVKLGSSRRGDSAVGTKRVGLEQELVVYILIGDDFIGRVGWMELCRFPVRSSDRVPRT